MANIVLLIFWLVLEIIMVGPMEDRSSTKKLRAVASRLLKNANAALSRPGNAKYLDASDRLQFLGINEIGVERDGVGFAKKLHQSAILFDQIVLPARRPARCDACAGVSNR